MTQSGGFMPNLVAAVIGCGGGPPETRRLIGRAIADTLAVAAAGFAEDVTRSSLAAYAGDRCTTWSGISCESRDAAVFINAVAAHALDFDDVLLDSTLHASAVILPAILETDFPASPDELIAAFGAGLIAARAIGRRVGSGHYYKGWHATGTFGALVAAAAAARLHRLDEARTRAALALAAAQAGGMKLNFGTMAKPCHAGFAASAGVRSVRLALAGVDGATDIFAGALGFPALYGTDDGEAEPGGDAFALRPDRVLVKLYPCCTAAHRLIGVALDAREALGPDFFKSDTRAVLHAPTGSLDLLREDDPKTPQAAQFSARYCLAVALASGAPSLAAFTYKALGDPGLPDLLERVVVVDDPAQVSGGNIEMGHVLLELQTGSNRHIQSLSRAAIPGGPSAPPAAASLAWKMEDCLKVFQSITGHEFTPLASLRTHGDIGAWLRDLHS